MTVERVVAFVVFDQDERVAPVVPPGDVFPPGNDFHASLWNSNEPSGFRTTERTRPTLAEARVSSFGSRNNQTLGARFWNTLRYAGVAPAVETYLGSLMTTVPRHKPGMPRGHAASNSRSPASLAAERREALIAERQARAPQNHGAVGASGIEVGGVVLERLGVGHGGARVKALDAPAFAVRVHGLLGVVERDGVAPDVVAGGHPPVRRRGDVFPS